MNKKICSRCNMEYPVSTEYFYKDKNGLYGLRSICKICQKKYREENKEKIKKSKSEYYQNNKEKIEEHKKIYRLNNKDKVAKWHKNVQNKNKEKYLEDRRKYSQKRRAILNGLDNDFTEEDWLYCKEYFNYSCAYCGNTNNLTQEHVIPVTKGGSYSKNNIIPACTACNCSKQNEDMNIWYKNQSFYDVNKERKIYQYIQNI